MKTNFKTKLLLGAAVTALSFGVATGANAADFAVDENNSNDGVYETDQAGPLDLSTYTTHDIRVDATGTIETATGEQIGDGTATQDAIVAAVTGQTLTIDDATNTGAASTVTVAGDIDLASGIAAMNLTITGEDTDNTGPDTLLLDINGNVNLGTGALVVTADGVNANNDVTVNISGNVTAASTTLNAAAADAVLTFDGATAQTVAGTIVGGGAGQGDIVISNTHASGVTFTGALGGTTLDTIVVSAADGTDQSVTFQGNVATANGITLGNNSGTETVAATFGGSAATAVASAIAGGGTENSTLAFVGGDTVTLTGAVSAIDSTSVTGDTTVTTDSNFASTNITVASGSTFATTANDVTGAIANSGTLILGGGDVIGNITGSGSLNATADGTVTGSIANTVTIADNVTLTIDGTTGNETISGAIAINDSGVDDGLTVDSQGNTVTFSGDITTGTTGQGLITIADDTGTVAFTGNVGTSAKKIGVMNLAGAAANTVTVAGNLYVDATDLVDAANTLQFVGTSAQTASGTIDGPGVLTIGNGTDASDVTFADTVGVVSTGLSSASVALNSTARFNANTVITGAYAATGTTHVGEGATLDVGSTTGTGGFVLDASDADGTLTTADIGVLDFSGTEGALARSEVTVNVVGALGTGTVDVLADGGDAFADAGTLVDNSFQYSFTAATTGVLTVARSTLNSLSTGNSVTNGVANTLDGLVGSTDAQVVIVNNNLAAASTQQGVNDVLESVTPSVDAGAVVGATSFVTQTSNVTNTQLASLRDGTEASGMYAGNVTNGLRGWVQGFGLTGDQDRRDGVAGYDVDSYGLAVGLDTQSLADNWIWGLAFAYSDTDVDSDGVNNTNTDIDSYQVSLYGSYDLDDRTYISGQAGYVWGDNDQTRYNVGGANSGITADADYDSDVIFAGLEAGRKYMVGGNTVLTPKAMVNYQHYDADGYTETGAGGLNLTTNGEEIDLFEIGVGVDASWDYQQADGSYLQPKIGVGVRHDLIGDEYQTTSNFAAAPNASFKTEGFDPAQTTFNVSADLTYFSTTNWELSAGYDFEYKSDYDSHAGTLKAAYKF